MKQRYGTMSDMARPRVHTDELRETLLTRTAEAVAGRGAAAVSLRDVAAAAGTSTTAIYSLFGNKEALLQAVLVRAFEQFAQAQETVPVTDDPVADILGLGATYVGWALEHPAWYSVMFGGPLVGITCLPEADAVSARSMAPLHSAVERGLAAGVLRSAAPETIAISLWAQVHGLSTLALAGHLPPGADLAAAALADVEGWVLPS